MRPVAKAPAASKKRSVAFSGEEGTAGAEETMTKRVAATTASKSKTNDDEEDGEEDLEFEDPFEDQIDEEDEAILARSARAVQRRTNTKKSANGDMNDDGADEVDDDMGDEEEEEDDDEDLEDDEGADEQMAGGNGGAQSADAPKKPEKFVWRPSDGMSPEEQLDYDSTAYAMLHRMKVDWPCLSFDIVPDKLGAFRTKYPHTMYFVSGTQADQAHRNKIMLFKVRDLHKTLHDDEDDDDADEDDDDNNEKDDAAQKKKKAQSAATDADEDDDDEACDDDPILEDRSIPHHGAVNRLRVCPHMPGLIATMADTGKTHIYDATAHLKSFDLGASAGALHSSTVSSSTTSSSTSTAAPAPLPTKVMPLFTFPSASEGYALAWSRLVEMRLAIGNCSKQMFVLNRKEGGGWAANTKPFKGHVGSVEDIQWSPTDENSLASCSCDKTVRVWDVRTPDKTLSWVAASRSDVNVIAWNEKVSHLIASGADDGTIKVWDLRNFKSNSPAATFQWHKDAITSIEWHPHEESILAASSADDSITVWDLALESDPEEIEKFKTGAEVTERVPDQLFFVHQGQSQIKEIHWHAQLPNCLLSTAADGINIFQPSNLM